MEEKIKHVRRITQRGDFNNNFTSKVGIVLPEIYATKTVTWNFHVNEFQGSHKYDIIPGLDILYKLNMDLCLSNNTIRVNRGTYEEYTALMNDFKIFNSSSN